MEWLSYKVGWMIVAFDLPVKSKLQRRAASDFRKFLLEEGFQMIQFSFYARSMVTQARMETHMRRIKKSLPTEGSVRAIYVTQAQWERSYVAYGKPAKEQNPEEVPQQLQFW